MKVHPSRQCGTCNNRIIGEDWGWYSTTGSCRACNQKAGVTSLAVSPCRRCGKYPVGEQGQHIAITGFCQPCARQVELEIEEATAQQRGLTTMNIMDALGMPGAIALIKRDIIDARQDRIEKMLSE